MTPLGEKPHQVASFIGCNAASNPHYNIQPSHINILEIKENPCTPTV
jgi:hypothetical protein